MELYLFNVDVFDKGQFQLILEGDNSVANDGDWKAIGGGAAILGQLSGYWHYSRRQIESGWWQFIDIREGDYPNVISWLWRRDWDQLANLDLRAGVPYLGGDVFLLDPGTSGSGSVANWHCRSPNLEWKVVRRSF